jgi:hypothetical protein
LDIYLGICLLNGKKNRAILLSVLGAYHLQLSLVNYPIESAVVVNSSCKKILDITINAKLKSEQKGYDPNEIE